MNPWAIVGIWFVVVALHAAYYVSSILEHADVIQEWYARTRHYQLLMFAIVRFPLWLGVLLGLLLMRTPNQSDTGHEPRPKRRPAT